MYVHMQSWLRTGFRRTQSFGDRTKWVSACYMSNRCHRPEHASPQNRSCPLQCFYNGHKLARQAATQASYFGDTRLSRTQRSTGVCLSQYRSQHVQLSCAAHRNYNSRTSALLRIGIVSGVKTQTRVRPRLVEAGFLINNNTMSSSITINGELVPQSYFSGHFQTRLEYGWVGKI